MKDSYSESYKQAGVDITAGYKAVELMKKHVARTMPQGKADIGDFGGAFPLPKGMKEPVLVSGTDGVGTKLKIAMLLDKHDTIGIDCVAMCVNDVICCGAKPLFFLDYIACGKNVPEKIADIVGGGFYENMPRSIPKGLGVKIKKSDVKVLPIFDLIQKTGNISEHDMYNTFNMGVGMCVAVAKENVQKALEILKANGEDAYVIGEIVRSDSGVILE